MARFRGEAFFFVEVLLFLRRFDPRPGDNASSIKSETNGSDNDGSKHVDVMAHYVRERMRAGDLHYTYVATNENIADCMTKNSYYPAFKKFRAAMGVA